MAVSTPSNAGDRHPPGRIDQLYVTHCNKQDSVQKQGGYSVRATSVHNEGLFGYARAFPGLEKPMGLSSPDLSPREVPRRLVLAREGGKSVLVHTSYLPVSSDQRSHIFFSHFLIFDRLQSREALTTWGSPSWQMSYPEGASQVLEPFGGVPANGVLNQEALQAFLSDAPPPPDQDLATTVYPVYPPRLARSADRRQLVRMALQGYLLIRNADPSAPRGRLFIQAEPGVVALLIYAIARLFPPKAVEGLTFSTYEAYHKEWLRRPWGIQVLGTFTTPARPLEIDFLTRLGYGIDTLSGVASKELQEESAELFDELIAMAAAGNWTEINWIHAQVRDATGQVEALLRVILLAHQLRRKLEDETATIQDVLRVWETPVGQNLLRTKELRDLAWPVVRASRFQREIAQKFTAMFREPELQSSLVEGVRHALVTGSAAEWKREWEALKWHLKDREAADRFRALLNVSAGTLRGGIPLATRTALLSELRVLEPSLKTLSAEYAWLLDITGDGELATLALSGLPPEWLGQAAANALAAGPSAAALETLRRGGEPTARGCSSALAGMPEAMRNEAVARALVPGDPSAPEIFGHLLRGGLNLDPRALDALLVRAGADQRLWDPCWTIENLELVLSRLRPDSEFAGRLWRLLLSKVTTACLQGDTPARRHFRALRDLRARLNGNLPADVDRALHDWALLDAHMTAPKEGDNSNELKVACNNLGVSSRRELLRLRYAGLLDEHRGRSIPDPSLQTFARCVRGFYGNEDQALEVWLELLGFGALSDRRRTACEAAYFRTVIPPKQWTRLLEKYQARVTPETRIALFSPPQPPPPPSPVNPLLAPFTAATETELPPWILYTAAGTTVAIFAFLLIWSVIVTVRLTAANGQLEVANGKLKEANVQIATLKKRPPNRQPTTKNGVDPNKFADLDDSYRGVKESLRQKEDELKKKNEELQATARALAELRTKFDEQQRRLAKANADANNRAAATTVGASESPSTDHGGNPGPARGGAQNPQGPVKIAHEASGITGVAYYDEPRGDGLFVWTDGRPDFSYSDKHRPNSPLVSQGLDAIVSFTHIASGFKSRSIVSLGKDGVEVWPKTEGTKGYFTFPHDQNPPVERSGLTCSQHDDGLVAWVTNETDPSKKMRQRIFLWDSRASYAPVFRRLIRNDSVMGMALARIEQHKVLAVCFKSEGVWFHTLERPEFNHHFVLDAERDVTADHFERVVDPSASPGKGCTFSSDGQRLAFACRGGAIVCRTHIDKFVYRDQYYDRIVIERPISLPVIGSVTCITFDPKVQLVALGVSDGSVLIYDMIFNVTWRLPPMADLPQGPVIDLAFKADGQELAVAAGGKLTIRNVEPYRRGLDK